MVADDTAFVRDRFKAVLETAGHRAIVVASGGELLARVKAEAADIDLIRVRTRVDLGYPVPGWWGTELRVAGINTRRVADEAILYTPWFGPRTLTSSAGTEVILSVASPIAPWGEVDGTVIAIRRGAGNTRIRCAASTRSRRLRMEQERAECEEGASDEGHGVRWFARTATTAARWHPRSRVHANEQRPGSPKMWGLGGAGTEHTPPCGHPSRAGTMQ